MGLGLSAASGFRIFIPFMMLSILPLSGIDISASGPAFFSTDIYAIIFLILSVTEVILYYNPWMDNMLDLISTPVSIFSGIMLSYLALSGAEFYLRLIISVVLGGGISLNIQLLTVKARSLTSIFKKGNGNKIVSTIENISSLLISILSLIYPILSVLTLAIIIFLIYKFIIKKGYKAENRNFLKMS